MIGEPERQVTAGEQFVWNRTKSAMVVVQEAESKCDCKEKEEEGCHYQIKFFHCSWFCRGKYTPPSH